MHICGSGSIIIVLPLAALWAAGTPLKNQLLYLYKIKWSHRSHVTRCVTCDSMRHTWVQLLMCKKDNKYNKN